MAKAKQLPSGAWRVRATHTDENGVKITASFTDANPKVAEAKAAMWQAGMLERDADLRHLPLGEAIDAYIETGRCTGMSPSTIRAYVSARNNAFEPLLKRRVNKITLRDVQSWINWRAQNTSPKTVKNNYDLLVCVLKQNEVPLDLGAVRLPKRKTVELEMPSDEQIAAMLNSLRESKDSDLFIAVMLASLYGLRRSEICALEWTDIRPTPDGGHVLVVDKALVRDENNLHAIKDTKTESGSRVIAISDSVYAELMKRRNLRTNLVSLSPNALTNRYATLAKRFGVCSKFHGLRHYMSSFMALENVNPMYAAKLLGHASPTTTTRIYTHVMGDKVIQINSLLDNHVAAVLEG